MNRIMRKWLAVGASSLLAVSLIGCSGTPGQTATGSAAPTATESAPADAPQSSTSDAQSPAVSSEAAAQAGAPAKTEMKKKDLDDSWNAGATQIQLNGDSASSNSAAVAIDGSMVTIGSAGTYVLSGTLNNGRILVEAADTDDVQLVLNGASITSQDGPGIQVNTADKVILTLGDGSENTVTDGQNYADTSDGAPNAAIYSEQDLSINGSGTLTVTGQSNNGISTKDDLKIAAGTITVKASNHALKGKDSVSILDGNITLEAGGDGIQSDQDQDVSKGWIVIDGGTFKITAEQDAIQSETGLTINGGEFDVTTGGGHTNGEDKTAAGRPNGFFPGGMNPFDAAQGDGTQDGERVHPGGRPNDGLQPQESADPQGSAEAESADMQETRRPRKEQKQQATAEGTLTEDPGAGFADPAQSSPPEPTEDASSPTDAQSASPETVPDDAPDGITSATTNKGTRPDKGERRQRPSGSGTPSGEQTVPVPGTDASGSATSTKSDSHKGLKAGGTLTITGGSFTLDCADDTIHTNGNGSITGGTFTLSSGDDAVHADGDLTVHADMQILESYEGLEACNLNIEGGNIDIKSSDDGINAADGSGGFGAGDTSKFSINISGGTIHAVCGGDGLDSNGDIRMSGGDLVILVDSTPDNGALDFEGSFIATGGTIIYGGSGTGPGPNGDSTQSYVFAQGPFSAGTEVTVRDGDQTILSFTPAQDCSSLAFSSPQIADQKTYTIYSGDTLMATATAGEGGSGIGDFGSGHRGPFGQGISDGQQPNAPQMPEDGQMPEGEPPAGFGDRMPGEQPPALPDGQMPDVRPDRSNGDQSASSGDGTASSLEEQTAL